MLVAVHVSATGSYLSSVFVSGAPPQTTILTTLLAHTAVCRYLALGAPVVLVVCHVFVAGSYLPPVLRLPSSTPPQTIILLPVHTAV